MAVPVLLIQREGVSESDIAALRQSNRVQVFHERDVGESIQGFALRAVRATVVATERDPLDELVYVRTSGIGGPLVIAARNFASGLAEALAEAGVTALVQLPMDAGATDQVVDLVEQLPGPPFEYPPLGLYIDPIARVARRGSASVRLSQRELGVLHCLVRNAPRPVRITDLYTYVWGSSQSRQGIREIVDVNISQVRKKLRSIGLGGAIRTYRDFGYGLEASSEPEAQTG